MFDLHVLLTLIGDLKVCMKASEIEPGQAKNENLFVCPLPTYSPKMGPTHNILLPFHQIFFLLLFFCSFFFFLMFLSEDKFFPLESNVF